MTQPPGMADFFSLEAGEYLERLDALLQGTDAPAAEEFVRLARALRGAALMAGHPAVARPAAGLEALSRAVREGRLAWDARTRQLATRAVDDLKQFVRRAATWSEADGAKAEALAAQLEQSAGRPSAQVRAAEALGLDAGARAFVAREGAAIASALDRAAQTLRVNPLAHDPLQGVLRALQPLRGLAALADLPPLPDVLDGIERAIGELSRAASPPADAGDLFEAAARAIAHSAREVAERGRPDPEGADFRRFAERLVRLFDADEPVVPIDTLFHGGPGPHIVKRGTPVARPATLGRLELVSHGEHLRQAADSVERAPSPTQRELRAHALGGTFRALGNAGGGPLADAVARFGHAARDAVTSGAALREHAAFAADLRRAGELLAGSAAAEEGQVARELDQITASIGRPRPVAAATETPAERVETSVISDALVDSWATYQRLVASGVGAASLDELLAGPGQRVAAAAPAPAAPAPPPPPRRPSAPAAAVRAPSVETPSIRADGDVVDIRSLLFRGDRALARAHELRAEARRAASAEHLQALVDEVCDLVALALEPSA
jgi:hypothetical protein